MCQIITPTQTSTKTKQVFALKRWTRHTILMTMLLDKMKKANTQLLTSDLINAIIIAISHVFSEHVSGAPGIDLYLMFTSNRALVVLISSGDKNLKVSGLLLGEELCAFCAPYFDSSTS